MIRTMCDVTRRNLLLSTAVFARAVKADDEINHAVRVAKDVYFHQGDIEHQGHCNNGWIIFKDYVLVIDANFPSGAQNILPKIRALASKPIRFAYDTHHHGDHAYGNQVWVDNGATPVAHTGVIEEMKRYETGYYGNTPGRWEETAKTRPSVRKRVKEKQTPRQIFDAVAEIREEILAQPRVERYASKDGLNAQVEKVYNEMTGGSFPPDTKTSQQARLLHRHAHAAVQSEGFTYG
jgi:hypothetical protein